MGGGKSGKAVVQGPEAQYPPEEQEDEDWGFASAFLFALSLITTVGKGTFTAGYVHVSSMVYEG